MSDSTAASIPIIDLSNPDRKMIAKKLAEAMETIGFAYMDNIPGYDAETEASVWRVIEWFFSLPLEQKLQCSPKMWNEKSKGLYKGYYPIKGGPSISAAGEKYMFGDILEEDDPDVMSGIPFYELPPLPNEDGCGVPFRDTMVSHRKLMENAGLEAARLLAMELGINEDSLIAKFVPKSCSDLKPLHFPKQLNGPSILVEEHIDIGFITLLSSLGYEGLQIRLDDGTWIDVVPRPGSVVVNIGNTLAGLSKGRFKATRHRVRNMGEERYSLPYFFMPRFDAKFDILEEGEIKSITYGPWAIKNLKNILDFSHLPDY